MEKVLLFEGLPQKGGKAMFGRSCIRYKTVQSKVLGRPVRRCAQFAGSEYAGYDGLGALPFNLEAVKDTLMTGAVAVGGAVGVRKVSPYIVDALKIDPMSKWRMGIEVGLGLGAGFLIGKYANKPDLGAAVAVGPVVINGMELAGEFLTPPQGPPVAGTTSDLGVAVEQGQLPAWTEPSPFIQQVQERFPAWSLG